MFEKEKSEIKRILSNHRGKDQRPLQRVVSKEWKEKIATTKEVLDRF